MLTKEDLIGMKVNMTKDAYQLEWAGELHDVVEYRVADPEMEAKIKAILPTARILPPTEIITLEFRQGRWNVHLNEQGTIIRVNEG